MYNTRQHSCSQRSFGAGDKMPLWTVESKGNYENLSTGRVLQRS
jgi:hypothetical protein